MSMSYTSIILVTSTKEVGVLLKHYFSYSTLNYLFVKSELHDKHLNMCQQFKATLDAMDIFSLRYLQKTIHRSWFIQIHFQIFDQTVYLIISSLSNIGEWVLAGKGGRNLAVLQYYHSFVLMVPLSLASLGMINIRTNSVCSNFRTSISITHIFLLVFLI